MKNFFRKLAIFLTLGITSLSSYSQVVINEFCTANRSNYMDSFGDFDDWIELYNTGGAAVNLAGFHLSDKLTNPTKWVIPAINLAPGGRIVIWASNRNVTTPPEYHTNFALTQSQNPEVILFTNAAGSIVDSVSIRACQANHSRGRTTDGAATWSVFTNPTPNATNAGAYTGYATRPVMSIPPGKYPGAVTVALSSPDPGVTIRYTLNGFEPTATSTAYSGPINITATTVVKAKAFSSNPAVLPSFTETNTYLINTNHTIPVVSISSDDIQTLILGNAGLDGSYTYLEYFGTAGTQIFETAGTADHHGNDSWAMSAHKGVDYVVRDEMGYDDAIDYQLFPPFSRNRFRRIILKSGASDGYPGYHPDRACHLRDAFSQSMSQRAGLDLDERSFIWTALYVNGQYWGLYDLREKTMDPDFTEYYYNQDEEDLDFLTFWGGLTIRYGSDTGWVNTYNYIMSNNMANQAMYNEAAQRIKVTSLIDYIILNTWTVNSDWMNWNTMWWRGNKNPKTKWRYVCWDMDNTFDLGENFSGWPTTGFSANPCDLNNNFQNAGPNMGHLDVFNKMMDNPGFKSQYVNRYAYLLNNYFNCTFPIAHLDSIVAVMTPEMNNHAARWGGNMAQWQSNIQYMKDQITGRCAVINTGITDCYNVTGPFPVVVEVSPAGSGNVVLNGNNLSVYPWTGNFFGGVNMDLQGVPAAGWNFWYWELKNHTVLPDTVTNIVSFLLATGDTIVAHFRQPNPPVNLTILVDPPLSGNASISSFTPPVYPFTGTYFQNSTIDLSATPFAGYSFVNWELAHHSVNPSATAGNTNFTLLVQDTIIAHFKKNDPPKLNLTLDVQPPNSGKIKLNSTLIPTYIHVEALDSASTVNLVATPEMKYEFLYWTIKHHTLSPDTLSDVASFYITQGDTVIAWFAERTAPEKPLVHLPNSFTPDGDQVNDYFTAFVNDQVTEGSIVVFSRWGEEIFKSGSLQFAWDGNNNGKPCQQGVYNYILTYKTQNDGEFTILGSVTLLR